MDVLLKGESLVNDASGFVLFRFGAAVALKCSFRGSTLTTEILGWAIIRVAQHGLPRPILEAAKFYPFGSMEFISARHSG